MVGNECREGGSIKDEMPVTITPPDMTFRTFSSFPAKLTRLSRRPFPRGAWRT